jgi:hypothetical protein
MNAGNCFVCKEMALNKKKSRLSAV